MKKRKEIKKRGRLRLRRRSKNQRKRHLLKQFQRQPLPSLKATLFMCSALRWEQRSACVSQTVRRTITTGTAKAPEASGVKA